MNRSVCCTEPNHYLMSWMYLPKGPNHKILIGCAQKQNGRVIHILWVFGVV